MTPLVMDAGVATKENFDEIGYLAANEDVARAVKAGEISSGRFHFDRWGKAEGRRQRDTAAIQERRKAKLQKFDHCLNKNMKHITHTNKYDFLTKELREEMNIIDTRNVADHEYDSFQLELINEYADGKVLDCGCGKRNTYYDNILNFEIVNYDTTDVIGVGEALPFKDNSFDMVISNAVLEHVFDPFKCAQEIVRVLKPGGRLIAGVPFLQPIHGYPHHYYNMSIQGLSTLFSRFGMRIEQEFVPTVGKPIFSLSWVLNSWSNGLTKEQRADFEKMTVRELMQNPHDYLDKNWVTGLREEKNFELASGNIIIATK